MLVLLVSPAVLRPPEWYSFPGGAEQAART
jgi:hypothetical protein